jgi:hypothetical protein
MGRTDCTEPQCLYSTAVPLLPLWAVRPVQSLSACTRVHFTLPYLNNERIELFRYYVQSKLDKVSLYAYARGNCWQTPTKQHSAIIQKTIIYRVSEKDCTLVYFFSYVPSVWTLV